MGATIVLISLMIAAAKLWGWVKKKYPEYASIGVRVFVGIILIVFLFF